MTPFLVYFLFCWSHLWNYFQHFPKVHLYEFMGEYLILFLPSFKFPYSYSDLITSKTSYAFVFWEIFWTIKYGSVSSPAFNLERGSLVSSSSTCMECCCMCRSLQVHVNKEGKALGPQWTVVALSNWNPLCCMLFKRYIWVDTSFRGESSWMCLTSCFSLF